MSLVFCLLNWHKQQLNKQFEQYYYFDWRATLRLIRASAIHLNLNFLHCQKQRERHREMISNIKKWLFRFQHLCRHIFQNQHKFMKFVQKQVRLCSNGTARPLPKASDELDIPKVYQIPPQAYNTQSLPIEHEPDNGHLFKVCNWSCISWTFFVVSNSKAHRFRLIDSTRQIESSTCLACAFNEWRNPVESIPETSKHCDTLQSNA